MYIVPRFSGRTTSSSKEQQQQQQKQPKKAKEKIANTSLQFHENPQPTDQHKILNIRKKNATCDAHK